MPPPCSRQQQRTRRVRNIQQHLVAAEQHYDLLVRGGTIFDGQQTPRYVADVGIKDGKVAKVGSLKDATADEVINATGKHVCPGFIDLHTHYDSQIFWVSSFVLFVFQLESLTPPSPPAHKCSLRTLTAP